MVWQIKQCNLVLTVRVCASCSDSDELEPTALNSHSIILEIIAELPWRGHHVTQNRLLITSSVCYISQLVNYVVFLMSDVFVTSTFCNVFLVLPQTEIHQDSQYTDVGGP